MVLCASLLTSCAGSTNYVNAPFKVPGQPSHVVAEAKRGPVVVGKVDTKKCDAGPATQKEACKAQLVALAIRRSEIRKARALRDAKKHHDSITFGLFGN